MECSRIRLHCGATNQESSRRSATTDRAALVVHCDLEPMSTALRLAPVLTRALTSELAPHSPPPVRQPHVIEAHITASEIARHLTNQAASAHDELRRAHAALHPTEWALPTGLRGNQEPSL